MRSRKEAFIRTVQKSRLIKLFAWIIIFMLTAMCFISFYDSNQRVSNTRHKTKRTRHTVWLHYASPDNTSTTVRPLRDLVEVPRPESVKWDKYAFLKVHKAASTTTQAIFLRYGWNRNLTFVLPPEYNNFGYPNIISTNESLTPWNILPPPPGKAFDILCHHVVYDKNAWDKVLKGNTVKIGTVREPFSHFRSSLNYFGPYFLTRIKSPNPVTTFLQNPKAYNKNIRSSFIHNRMAFEYGVQPDIITNRDFAWFEKYLWTVLDKEFSVVLVNEKFDESLLIMKKKLNWDIKDILYVSLNERPKNTPDRYVLSDLDKTLYKDFAVFDYMLYNFFAKKLENEIQNVHNFQEELKHFLNVKQSVSKYCFTPGVYRKDILPIDKSEWNKAFDVSTEDCKLMLREEIEFTQDIRRKQYGYATWTWK